MTLEEELKEVERLKKDLEAKIEVGTKTGKVWIPEKGEWTVHYAGSRYGTFDVEEDVYEVEPAHYEEQTIVIYEPDVEKRKQAQSSLDQMFIDTKFFSVKYATLPEDRKERYIKRVLPEFEHYFNIEDGFKFFELSKSNDIKNLLVKETKIYGYEEGRQEIRDYLRTYFERNELEGENKREIQLTCWGSFSGFLGSIVGAVLANQYSPEFQEFMDSWKVAKEIGIIAGSTSALGIIGKKIGKKIDKRRVNKQYNNWLKE